MVLDQKEGECGGGLFLLIVPLICFVICAGLTLGLPKVGVASEFWILWTPALVGAISLALAGNALAVAD